MTRAGGEEAFLATLLATERLPGPELEAYQADLIQRFLAHAAANVPFYRDRRPPTALLDTRSPAWLDLPTISRATLAAHGEALRASEMPPGHGAIRHLSSGGSTAEPIQTAVSGLDVVGRVAVTYRLFTALGMDQGRPLFMIRNRAYAARWGEDRVFRKWGFPWRDEAELGDRVHMDIDLPADAQLRRLTERAPSYVNTLPRNVLGLGLESRRSGMTPSIPVLIAAAEYLAPEVASLARQRFGSHVIDILTSSEAGPIAIQCPDSNLLHIQSERILVELLNETGRPCAPGETGEVVVTPFYNYAMPLIRYRSGDFAIAGGPCPCGRSLPTIERFAGRRESMFRYPDGSHRLPPIDRVAISEWLGHQAWQLVQTGPGKTELRHEPATGRGDAADAITAHVLAALGPGWTIGLVNTPVPMTGGGKRHYTLDGSS
ncbi:MAG: hypothetical protein ABI399_04100 [Bauldia sp.]